MACTCFNDVAAKADSALREKYADSIGKVDESRFDREMLSFSRGDYCPVSLNYIFRYYRKKKDGTNEQRITNSDVYIVIKHCPFCGTKFNGKAD